MITTLSYEEQYYNILKEINENGYCQKNERTGIATLRIPHAVIQVNLQKEFPILKCKEVFWKSALHEILWIMQKQSNNIHDLKPHIWDEWADENGLIGKAYGYQVGKEITTRDKEHFNSQVHYVLETLAKDSSDRRCVINLWNVDELSEMNLVPCCFVSVWNIIDGKLNCLLTQRSADYLVGVPFNTTQYAMLTHLFARHLGVEPGQITHIMADCHIYSGLASHYNGMREMITRMDKIKKFMPTYMTDEDLARISYTSPRFHINVNKTDFFSINPEDCNVELYEHFPHIPFEVAV